MRSDFDSAELYPAAAGILWPQAANLSFAPKGRVSWCLFGVYYCTAPGRLRRPPKILWNASKYLL